MLADCLFCGSLEKARFLPSRPKVSGQFVIPRRSPSIKMKEWRLWGVRAGREFGVKNGTILILRPPVVASGAFQTAACGVAFVHGSVASGRLRFTLFRRNCDSASVSTSLTQERQFRGRGGSLGVARHGYSTAFFRRVHEVVALGTARSSPAFPAAREARCLKAT